MNIIGLYKTREAAKKGQRIMEERGIDPEQTSVLHADDSRGLRLASYAHHRAASYAWAGAAIGGAIGALIVGGLTVGEVEMEGVHHFARGHAVSALVGLALGLLPGALIGAIVGRRRPVLRADFFETDNERGGTALGVVTNTDAEAEIADYAFRSTGALTVTGRSKKRAGTKEKTATEKKTAPKKTAPEKTAAEKKPS